MLSLVSKFSFKRVERILENRSVEKQMCSFCLDMSNDAIGGPIFRYSDQVRHKFLYQVLFKRVIENNRE